MTQLWPSWTARVSKNRGKSFGASISIFIALCAGVIVFNSVQIILAYLTMDVIYPYTEV